MDVAYVALQHLVWGDGGIAPGEDVPSGEEGRDYGAMVLLGQIAEKRTGGGQVDIGGSTPPAVDLLALDELPNELDGVALIDGRPEAEGREVDIEDGSVGEYRKKPSATVQAGRLTADVKVLTPHGVSDGHAGDWLLVNTWNGEAWPVDPSYFDENYESAVEADAMEEPADDAAEPKPEAPAESPADAPPEEAKPADPDALPAGVTAEGGGWFRLPDGTKVRGRAAVDEALASS